MMELHDKNCLLFDRSSLVGTCYHLPDCGDFTIGQIYGFIHTEKCIVVLDNHGTCIFLPEKDFAMHFNHIGEVVTSVLHPMMYDETVYHIYLILENNTCNLKEIKAYAKILHLNYVQAKQALTGKRNLIISGSAISVKEILCQLKMFQVEYEIEPPYPYE